MSSSKTTPMIKQYLSIKEVYADAILFYRMGDFYEMFFEDAETASRVLEITLTSRNKKDKTPIPMCGVPHRAAKGYIARLIDNGYKVAICDQIEDPATAKGLVKRDVVRVITPGMIVDDEFLDEKTNNYVLALAITADRAGLSYLDISTGSFRVTEAEGRDTALEAALSLTPSEILLPASFQNNPTHIAFINNIGEIPITYLEDRAFDFKRAYERLTDQFQTVSLEGFGCESLKAGIRAAGALVYYIRETQKQKIAHLTRLETYSLGNHLIIDEISWQNLEIASNIRSGSRRGTLLGIMDQTRTAMGARLLNNWLRYPLIQADEIISRLDAVEEAKNHSLARRDIRDSLKSVYDIERVENKIVMGHANARDLTALKRSLKMLPGIWAALEDLKSEYYQDDHQFDHLDELAGLIDRAIRDDAPPTINEGGMIKAGYNEELDELVQISRDGKGFLAQLEVQEREETGINTLKVRYNKVFGYYIEVPKSRSESVPAHYVRKQTLVNAERYITDELKSFEMKVLGAEDQRADLEFALFNEIREEVTRHHTGIQSAARFLARLDCLLNLAEIAELNEYCRPRVTTDGSIQIEDGRHPVVEKMITAERFVPNSVHMDNEQNQILIITGPNMAGKSTILRQVALLTVMAQIGSFIPAGSASISITDKIFTRVGALDNLSQGQSTFMVEMEETANILNNATADSLVIMDEIGRGTSTFDGLSIAWAVAEYLHDLNQTGVKTLFATHYHELTELTRTKGRIKNFNIAVKEWNDEIIFLRKLIEGGTNRSYGIQVARLAGIPNDVIQRAKKILYRIENGEQGVARPANLAEGDTVSPAGPVQLNLFRKPDQKVISALKQLEIGTMTPIEALNVLHDLQKEAENTDT